MPEPNRDVRLEDGLLIETETRLGIFKLFHQSELSYSRLIDKNIFAVQMAIFPDFISLVIRGGMKPFEYYRDRRTSSKFRLAPFPNLPRERYRNSGWRIKSSGSIPAKIHFAQTRKPGLIFLAVDSNSHTFVRRIMISPFVYLLKEQRS